MIFGFIIYIDDQHSLFFGESPRLNALANGRLLATTLTYLSVGLVSHPKKRVWCNNVPSPTLGFVVDVARPFTEVGVSPIKLLALASRTLSLVAIVRSGRPMVNVGLIQHVVSSWVWAFMVRRPLLSIFSKVFRKITNKSPHLTVRVSSSMCNELECAALLAPMAYHVVVPTYSTVGAFDASLQGYGVAYKPLCPPAILRELSARVETRGSWSAFSFDRNLPVRARLDGRRDPSFAFTAARWLQHDWSSPTSGWGVARSGAWSHPVPRHITLGEARAGLMLLQWFSGRSSDSRVIACGDNQPCLGALAKGRSSVWDINLVCRKVCALVLSTGLLPRWIWLASKYNPADGPSRWIRPVVMGWLRDFDRESGEASHPGPSALSEMRGPRVRAGKDYDERITGGLGLAFSSILPESAARYLRSVLGFTTWMRCVGNPSWALPPAVAEYVYWCFDTGQVAKSQCNNLVAALGILRPHLKARGALGLARRCISGWTRNNPSKSYLPIPRSILLAIAVDCYLNGGEDLAAALLLGFDCYLRHSELKHLMVSDIAFPGDPRLLVPDQGAVFIFCSKAGRKQWVTVRCPIAMGLLRRLSRGRRPSDYLFPDLRTSMLSRFRQAQVGIGLKKAPFVIHSLRHGGASYDYIRGLPITRIILRGRWGGLKVSRQYIQESQALVLELHIPRRARRAVKLYAHSDEVVKFYLDL